MRRLRAGLAALAVLLSLAGAAGAQGVPDADRAAIRDVITRQLDAFGRDDAAEAFSYAAPSIQSMFGTPERFLDMVRRAYPAVHRPRAVDFTRLTNSDGVVQEVELVGPDGAAQTALYSLERGPDGWRITGCTLVRSARIGV